MKTFIILAVSIGAMNLMGMSYASWNDGIQIQTKFSTGNLNYNISINKMPYMASEGSHKIEIENSEFDFSIENTGTVPIIINSVMVEGQAQSIMLSHTRQLADQQSLIIAPEQSSDNLTVTITGIELDNVEAIPIELLVSQYTD